MSVTLTIHNTKININLSAVPSVTPATVKIWDNFKDLDSVFPQFSFNGVKTRSLNNVLMIQSSYGQGLEPWVETAVGIAIGAYICLTTFISVLFVRYTSLLAQSYIEGALGVGLAVVLAGCYVMYKEEKRKDHLAQVTKFFEEYKKFIFHESKMEDDTVSTRLKRQTTTTSPFFQLPLDGQKEYLQCANAYLELQKHEEFFKEIQKQLPAN